MAILGRPLRPLALALAALAVGCAGFSCPPVNYQDHADIVPLAGGQVFLPIYKHAPQNNVEPKIAVIGLHGAGRNGDNYHGWVTNAMQKQGMTEDVVVITPVFADKDCSAAKWLGDPKAVGRAARWTRSTRQWVFGQKSDGFEGFDGISSFEAVDNLITWAEMTYKSITKIVVTGFSAGAQMGLRWAIMSPNGVQGTSLGGTPMTIILGSPSSVTYLSKKRPAKSCSQIGDQGTDHNCTEFLIPGSSPNAPKMCRRHWNRYGFGLGGLKKGRSRNGTIRADVSEYVHRFYDDMLLQETIAAHFATKNIVFQFGDTDTKDCIRGACADDCSAMDQGTSRLQRGLNYMAHLRDTFPGYEPQYSTFSGGHRPELFFSGQYFNKAAFDKSGWDECLWDSFSCFSFIWQCICGGFAFIFGGAGTGAYCHMKRKDDAVKSHEAYKKHLHGAFESVESGKMTREEVLAMLHNHKPTAGGGLPGFPVKSGAGAPLLK